jgi:excisionase family DNA binding protein
MPSNTSSPHAKRFLSVNDVAEELGVSTKHVRRMIARGDLRIYRFGKVIRIARDDLDRDVDRHRQ